MSADGGGGAAGGRGRVRYNSSTWAQKMVYFWIIKICLQMVTRLLMTPTPIVYIKDMIWLLMAMVLCYQEKTLIDNIVTILCRPVFDIVQFSARHYLSRF